MKKILIVIVFIILIVSINNVFASPFSLDEIFKRSNFGSGGFSEFGGITDLVKAFGTEIIQPIGYLIFAIATVGLGVKYIWSGYEGKSKVKETLPVFIIAVLMFYLADNVLNLVSSALSSTRNATSLEDVTGSIWANVITVVQLLAFGGILFIGVKYLIESPDGKAKLKERLAPMILGIIFVFCAAGVVNYIIKIGTSVM